MDTFLHQVALRLLHDFPDDMSRATVVFNNRRAGVFLRREIAHAASKSIFLPRIIGIDELVSELGGHEIIPNEFLLFELYAIHCQPEMGGRKFDTFEEFISFGETMLADFSEIDLYRVDAHALFNNLYEEKQIGEWNIETEGHPMESQYLQFYKSLYQYYTQLHERLEQKGRAYSGMAYRLVAEQMESLVEHIDCDHIYFVGFNALSASEETIIDTCIRRGIGSLIQDGDDYYYSDPTQEAGHFLRRYSYGHDVKLQFDNHFAQGKKDITFVNCPENVLQAKEAGALLDQLLRPLSAESDEGKRQIRETLTETAVVLADEQLLVPLLNSLPDKVRNTNVTMGFPYHLTATHELTIKLMSLYTHSKGGRFHHTDVLRLLGDSTIESLARNDKLHEQVAKAFFDQKVIYADQDLMTQLLSENPQGERIAFLFANAEPSTPELLENLRRVVALLIGDELLKNNDKEREAVACLLQTVSYLEELQHSYSNIDNLATLQRIYTRIARRRTVPFYGEPLTGLQILGMLETRSLDFKRLIILSANEGTLPQGRSDNSLIPLTLKRAFQLPTFEEKDSVYAYHFYRLLQRAEEVYLVFNSASSGMGKGEPSRFLLQLEQELKPRCSNVEIHKKVVSASTQTIAQQPCSKAVKGEKTLRRLAQMGERGFSPSSLSNYLKCPLLFYYQNVLGLKDDEEVGEDLESNELGDCVHELLHRIYTTDDHLVGADILQKALQEVLQEGEGNKVDTYFRDELLKGRSLEGRNHLYSEVAKIQISRFLQQEIALTRKQGPVRIVKLEEEMTSPIALQDGSRTVNIKGKADRIDYEAGPDGSQTLRIVDYKSGRVDPANLIYSGGSREEEPLPEPRTLKEKWFQVMTYAWLYSRHDHYQGPISSGIFPLRNLSSGFLHAQWDGIQTFHPAHINRFGDLLSQLVSDILNPEVPFAAAPRTADDCRYCPFSRICSKK